MDRRFPLGVIVLLLVAWLAARPVRIITLTIFRAPLALAQHAVGMVVSLPQLPEFRREHARLQTELAARQLEIVQLREALRRAAKTQALPQAFQQAGLSLPARAVVVSVLARPLSPMDHTLVLDRGTQQGVALDGLVIDAQGVVGRLLQVFPRTSVAMLLTDPNSRVACLVERSREHGLLVGTGERMAQLTYLDLDADVAVGDHVVTSGLGGIFPKGLPLGVVTAVARNERRARLQVSVRPAARFSQVEHLLYVPPSTPQPAEEPRDADAQPPPASNTSKPSRR